MNFRCIKFAAFFVDRMVESLRHYVEAVITLSNPNRYFRYQFTILTLIKMDYNFKNLGHQIMKIYESHMHTAHTWTIISEFGQLN